jgi:virulence factor Mce-like protein
MIGRIVATVVVIVLGIGVVVLLTTGGSDKPGYKVMLDNAFGLIEGADLKAAGVKVGKVKTLEVDLKTNRALVTTELMKPEFADFRSDVQCSVEPQSLIGEYFLNCQPGTDDEKLKDGATIPVEQTTGTIAPDLVNDIMRRPWRERFGIILSELGAGLGARGPELQETIKRAIPALRETDRVLKILANNRQVLRRLTANGDAVMTRLAGNRENVARFVSEARDTARASAERRDDLATNIRLLPQFLRELRPVLRDLGTTAERQYPALRDLRASADDLELLLRRLGPFAKAAGPAVEALGDASVKGTRAVRPARATVAKARRLGELAEDPARNLRFSLEHLDDRQFAVERNRLSPGGNGFTGLEALLQYVFRQSQAVNTFDANSYLLKVSAFLDNTCAQYTNAEQAKTEPKQRCRAILGPNQPGIDQPDPTATTPAQRRRSADRAKRRGGGDRREAAPDVPNATTPDTPSKDAPALPKTPEVPTLPPSVQDLLDDVLQTPSGGGVDPRTADPLLDFLFGS